jgi:flavin reductase (DIM6/NTAB) family NADH-FMN oxidoreductase RutF
MMQNHLSYNEIMALEQRYRASLINSLGGFKSVCLIGTQNTSGQTNLAIFNSLVHIGANPPLIGFIVRPDVAERHTLANILATNYYTINHINESIYEQAHQTAARYDANVSEFDATQLTPEYKHDFFAPYVQQSHVQLGVEFKQRIDLTINGAIFIIGEIKQVYYPQECLHDNGFIDLELAKTITCSGLYSYHTTQVLSRLSYAKPNTLPHKID